MNKWINKQMKKWVSKLNFTQLIVDGKQVEMVQTGWDSANNLF